MDQAVPTRIELHGRSQILALTYGSDESFQLSAEFLRVQSPSAEVRGHGYGQEKLQTGKRNVALRGVEPVGNYGVKLQFSDGHDTGIYTWNYLRELCFNQAAYWDRYLQRLAEAGASRDS